MLSVGVHRVQSAGVPCLQPCAEFTGALCTESRVQGSGVPPSCAVVRAECRFARQIRSARNVPGEALCRIKGALCTQCAFGGGLCAGFHHLQLKIKPWVRGLHEMA